MPPRSHLQGNVSVPELLELPVSNSLHLCPLLGITCLLRNLHAGQEATVRTGHGTRDWFQIGKGVHQSCILSPCLFNLYAEYIMKKAGLEEAPWSLPKPMSINSVMPSNHLIICHPLLLCPQSFPAPGSFLMSQLFASGGKSIGVLASASVLSMNTQD